MGETKIPILYCPTCYSTNFQESRIRPEDRILLFFRRHPVRCKHCRARIYASRSYVHWLRKEQETQKTAE